MLVAQKEDVIVILAMKAAVTSERFRNIESLVVQSNWSMVENASKQSHSNRKVAPHRR